MRAAPPRLARLLLRVLPRPAREYVVGDLEEEYASRILPERGRLGADLWFWKQALWSLGAFLRYRRHSMTCPAGPARVPLWSALSEGRSALRILTHRPWFAAVAVLTLGIGLGGAISVFSIANWVFLRPVPGVDDADRLAVVQFTAADGDDAGASYPNLRDLEAGAPAVERLAGHTWIALQASGAGLEPSMLRGEAVTPGYFQLLGVTASQGRLFATSELEPGAQSALAVLSHDAWRRVFGSDGGIVGRTLRLNGQAFTVIGIAERGFAGVDRLQSLDLWVPGSMYSSLMHLPAGYTSDRRNLGLFDSTVARLAPGATVETAERQLQQVAQRIVDAYGDDAGMLESSPPRVFAGIGLGVGQRTRLRPMMTLFYGVVSIILLIACANVANLLLLRSTHRQGATAVRRALGASRARLFVHHLAESLVLALPAAVAGILIASALNRLFWLSGFLPYTLIDRLPMDHRVVVFALALGIGTTLLLGIFPAVFASQVDVATNLRRDRFGTKRAAFVRGGLTVLQLSLSLALLVGAALLSRTLWNLQDVELGFKPEGVMTFFIDAGPQGYSRDETDRFHRELVTRVRDLAFVHTVSITAHPPFSSARTSFGILPPTGGDASESLQASVQFVAEDYFATLAIPVLRGRVFRPDEVRRGEDLVVLSETTARRILGERDPVSAVITASTFRGSRDFRVIGIVGDVRSSELRGPLEPTMYLPFPDYTSGFGSLLVGSPEAPERVTRAVQDVVRQLDANIPVYRSEYMSELVARQSSEERTLLRLLGVLAALAIALAGVGLCTVVSHTVAQRTREIGVRVALGADTQHIVRMVVRGAALLGAVGVAGGLVASAALARVLESRLYGVEPLDPFALGGAALFLGLVVLAASAFPARSASRVDPVRSLRAE